MPVTFIPFDRNTLDPFPPTVQDYLPESHLARFVVEIVEQLDLSPLVQAYSGRGSQPYHPAMLVALLFYGYATGVFSSRKLAHATHDSIAFRYICANTHPDHRTLSDFRKRFLNELKALFVQILLIAQAMGALKLGTVSLDGTKIHANANKHKALSLDHANRLEAQLKGEVDALITLAEQADNTPNPERLDIPEELERRQQRLEVIAAAKEEIAARAQARFEAEQAEYERKLAERQARMMRAAKSLAGSHRRPPNPAPAPKTRSTSPILNHASCPSPGAASSKPTTPRPALIPPLTSSSRSTSPIMSTTSKKSPPPWSALRPCPTRSAR